MARPTAAHAAKRTRFLTLSRVRDPERFVPAVLPWVHEAGNPYFDWFFGGADAARSVLRALMRSESSEVAIARACVLLEGRRAIGGFIALSGADLARARMTDTLGALKEVGVEERAGLAERIAAARDLFLPVEHDDFYLSKMGLVPERRGTGLGRVIVDEFLKCGAAAGFRRFALDVCADNLPAARLYRSAGFRLVRRSECAGMRYLGMILEP